MAYCNHCGNQLDENAKFCSSCGAANEMTVSNEEVNVVSETPVSDTVSIPTEPVTVVSSNTVAAARPERKGKAIVSLIFGLIGLLSPCLCCCISPLAMGLIGLLASVVAILFAVFSKKDTGGRMCGMAIAGLILAIFGILISLIVISFAVIFLIAEPFLPDFNNYYEVEQWLYENMGEDAAEWFSENCYDIYF